MDLYAQGKEVEVIVVDKPEDLWQIETLVGQLYVDKETTIAERLEQVDFDEAFVVGAFRRLHGGACRDVIIKHVTLQKGILTIYVHLVEDGDHGFGACTETETTYFHIVQVQRHPAEIEVDTIITKPIAITITPNN